MKECPSCRSVLDDYASECPHCGGFLSEENAQAVYDYAAGLMKKGLSESKMEKRLVDQGVDQEFASVVVKNLLVLRVNALKEVGKKNMVRGALWCLGGIVVTAATYSRARSGGGTYVVAWGVIVFGAIQFFRGLCQYGR